MKPDLPTWLVIGGAGFIGSSFVHAAVTGGRARVVNLDKLGYAGNLENLSELDGDDRHLFVKGDLADRALVAALLREHRPSAIVNFAAESHVDRSIDEPAPFLQTNVVGVFELLEAARLHRASLPAEEASRFRLLQMSTDEVFGALGPTGLSDEESRYAPSSPYAASKAAADHFVRAWHRTYGLPTLTVNSTNVYGPRQFPEKLIPLMLLNALDGKPLPIYGDGKHVRDWLYVDDLVEALLGVLDRGVPGQSYTIGARNERTNLELVHALCATLEALAPAAQNQAFVDQHGAEKTYGDLVTFVEDRPGHDRRYGLDPSKITNQLGWSSRHGFDEGLRLTVAWYLAHRDWAARITEHTYARQRLGLPR